MKKQYCNKSICHHIKKNKIPKNKPMQESKRPILRKLMKEIKDDTDEETYQVLGLEESIL